MELLIPKGVDNRCKDVGRQKEVELFWLYLEKKWIWETGMGYE
jgi:hypothetical protein